MAPKKRIRPEPAKGKGNPARPGKARQGSRKQPVDAPVWNKTILIIAAIVIILLVSLAALYYAYKSRYSLQNQKEILLRKLVSGDSELSVVVNGSVDGEKLQELSRMPYDELKSRMGVQNDFAIYFVNDNENLVPIAGKNCIGSPKAVVAGEACS
ncbi:hypothetical protein HYY72_05505 [Candidatus Woesearchaeota archaeon]|nr:hypothetical protein [Candidatus Woesearchaeota archaeon]